MVAPINTGSSIYSKESMPTIFSFSVPVTDNHNSNPKNEIGEGIKNNEEQVVQALENFIESNKTSLEITVDRSTDTIRVKVISDKDGKVIRRIPFESQLDLSV